MRDDCAAIYEVVDNQIRDGDPPETRQTLDRLMGEGHSQAEARRLIAAVVASEIFELLKHKRPYDRARCVADVRRLPKMLPDA